MKIINSKVHGFLDYFTVLVFLVAPELLGFSGITAYGSQALGLLHLATTLSTDFELGVMKLIPFPVHGWMERLIGPCLIVLPYIPGFPGDVVSIWYYSGSGAIIFLVSLLTVSSFPPWKVT